MTFSKRTLNFLNQPSTVKYHKKCFSVELVPEPIVEEPETDVGDITDIDIRQAAKLKGPEARRWFASQLMLPEWMIDVPDRLDHDCR
uniref:Uncharacterized protein n=1 Tax=Lactuca sativa TaxID=4236 RepID=A0A9R1VZZ1_LACSA|nr:hypothetical protein LSAT_V11C400173500 [Lactuca sativa]